MKFLSQINVNTEYTLPIVDGTNGQVLATDGNGNAYWGSISAGATNLDALTDVILTSPSSGQLLRYGIPPGSGETLPVWYNFTPNYLTPSSSIDNLGDVTITSATAGQILQWNGSAWVNATLSTVEYVSKVQHLVKAGVAITKGQAVYVTTSDGTNMIVGLASNAAESTSSKVIGLAASNAATNDQIFVVTEGLLAGLNTSTATAGDPVWLGTNGNLIFGLLNKPVAPAHLVYIGVVTRVQQNNGEIFVNVQNGFELNEIHDALIVSPTAGQLLRRDSDNLWKNWTPNYLTAHPTIANGGSVDNSNGTVIQDITLETNGHVTAITSVDLDTRYYTQNDISGIFGGEIPMAGYSPTNWDTAYNNTVTGVSFSTSTGVLTLTQQDTGTLTVDLDGRYLESETDTLASVTGRGNVTSTPIRVEAAATGLGGYISVGNSTEVAGNYSAYFFGNTAGDASYFKGGIAYETIASTYGRGNIHFLQNTSTSSGIVTLSDSVMTILNNGNVGIGTTAPAYKLDVSGGFRVDGTNGDFIVDSNGNDIYFTRNGTNYFYGTQASSSFAFYTNSNLGLFQSSAGNVGIARTSPSYKLDVAGNARFDNELYVGGVWSTSYGPRTAGGNIHFHDWSGNVRARINTVAGVTSVGNRKLSLGILDINSQGTPEIKINTKIPFALGAADFTVNIKGFQYGGTNMVSLSIGWHYYLSQFYNETAISNGSFSPTITLGVEPEGDYAGCVVIHLSNVGYWPKLYVESVYSSAYADDYVANWSWSDVGIDGLTSTTVVPYKPLETSITGNAAYATNAGNSITTSQTNFTTLTLSNAAVATQAWVTSQNYLTGAHTHSASDITSGILSTDRLPKQELGISIVGNFGQWQNHGAYQNLNTDVAYWGWNFAQGNVNAPHQVSSQWYRGRFSLGDEYGLGTSPGDYWMEIAIPRYNQDSVAGNLFVRTCENGSINAWQGVRAAYATDADTLDGNHASAFALASHTHTIANVTGLQTALDGKLSAESDTLDSVTSRGATTSNLITVTASEGREVAVYMPSSYTTDDLVSGHEYGWYSDHWRLGMTRSGGAAGADFVVQWNGERMLSLTNGGSLTIRGTFTEQSSIRYKENVKSIPSVSQKVEQLDAVSYNKIGSSQEEIGLIAEDVAELFPEVVKYDNEGRPDGVNYSRLSVILLKAVQELTERVNKLENK